MLHITFSKYDCIIVHKAYYLFTCTCVSINSFHSHSHSHISSVIGTFQQNDLSNRSTFVPSVAQHLDGPHMAMSIWFCFCYSC